MSTALFDSVTRGSPWTAPVVQSIDHILPSEQATHKRLLDCGDSTVATTLKESLWVGVIGIRRRSSESAVVYTWMDVEYARIRYLKAAVSAPHR